MTPEEVIERLLTAARHDSPMDGADAVSYLRQAGYYLLEMPQVSVRDDQHDTDVTVIRVSGRFDQALLHAMACVSGHQPCGCSEARGVDWMES